MNSPVSDITDDVEGDEELGAWEDFRGGLPEDEIRELDVST